MTWNFILNNHNNKNISIIFQHSLQSSDPAHQPSKEDDDEPKDEECLCSRWMEMWGVIAELSGADTSQSCSRNVETLQVTSDKKPSAELEKQLANVSPPV